VCSLTQITITDSHCHLDFEVFNKDRQDVINRARENGIDRILNPGIDIETSKAAIKWAEAFPEVYAAVGIHPNDALSWNETTLDELRSLARSPKVVAIGEIGLDYYRNRAPRDLQRHIFSLQLDLATELGLPIIIHNRDAWSDMLMFLSDWYNRLIDKSEVLLNNPGVLHSFSGELDNAYKVISINFRIGITGPVTFHKSVTLQSIVSSLPLEYLLIETDAPFLTPHPYRGRRNEPAYVRIVAEKIAELKNQTLETITEITSAGADQLFHWREIH
jgi:TatD DNase family protein